MLHNEFETEFRLVHTVAHLSKLFCLLSHNLNILSSFVTESAKKNNNFKFSHLILIINKEGEQLLVEVKESLNKLGVARIIHAEVAPFENDIEDLHDFTLLSFNTILNGLNTLDVLQELSVL